MSEYKLWNNPEGTDLGIEVNYRSLKMLVKNTERQLFQLKAQLAGMERPVHGKVVIPLPNEYRCATCGNKSCDFHVRWGYNKYNVPIHGHTCLNGCLAWLPEAP